MFEDDILPPSAPLVRENQRHPCCAVGSAAAPPHRSTGVDFDGTHRALMLEPGRISRFRPTIWLPRRITRQRRQTSFRAGKCTVGRHGTGRIGGNRPCDQGVAGSISQAIRYARLRELLDPAHAITSVPWSTAAARCSGVSSSSRMASMSVGAPFTRPPPEGRWPHSEAGRPAPSRTPVESHCPRVPLLRTCRASTTGDDRRGIPATAVLRGA